MFASDNIYAVAKIIVIISCAVYIAHLAKHHRKITPLGIAESVVGAMIASFGSIISFHSCDRGQPYNVLTTFSLVGLIVLIMTPKLLKKVLMVLIFLVVQYSFSTAFSRIVHSPQFTGNPYSQTAQVKTVTKRWHTFFTGIYRIKAPRK